MWEFFQSVLDKHGLAAVVILAVLAAFVYSIKVLWKRNQELLNREPHIEQLKFHLDEIKLEISNQNQVYDVRIQEQRDDFMEQLRQIHEERVEDAKRYGKRIDELQEKRTNEMMVLTRELVEHVGASRRASERVAETMDDMKALINR